MIVKISVILELRILLHSIMNQPEIYVFLLHQKSDFRSVKIIVIFVNLSVIW